MSKDFLFTGGGLVDEIIKREDARIAKAEKAKKKMGLEKDPKIVIIDSFPPEKLGGLAMIAKKTGLTEGADEEGYGDCEKQYDSIVEELKAL